SVVCSLTSTGSDRQLHSFPTRRSSDLPAQQRVLPAELRQPALQAGVEGVDAGKVLRLVPVDDGFFLIFRQLPHINPPHTRCKIRSEEHTSELQSRIEIVCRLLLEKKHT